MKVSHPLQTFPPRPLPRPLRGSDRASFAHHSVVVRLQQIIQRVLEENTFDSQQVESLKKLSAEIPEEEIRPLHIPNFPEEERWEKFIQPYAGLNWLEVPWFFAEHYFYMRVLEATGYFFPGPWQGVDPYQTQKLQSLESARGAVHALSEGLERLGNPPPWSFDHFNQFLIETLGGNQVDLSRWPGGDVDTILQQALQETRDHILVDDSPEAANIIAGLLGTSARVDVFLDNAGLELVSDLVLVDYLLGVGIQRIQLHVKNHPVFVSDALVKDFNQVLTWLQQGQPAATQALGERLSSVLENERLILRADSFWTSPLPGWEMPAELRENLANASLLISKGDANYRRLTGDLHWPQTISFDEITGYLPAPVLAVRSLKSEVLVGVEQSKAELAAKQDKDWMIDGQWGIIQL